MKKKLQKLKCFSLKTFALAILMVAFAMPAKAQTNKVYMHNGSRTLVGDEKINFYDSGGQSSGPSYYWERWFQRSEDYTFTFKPESGKKIKVTFKHFVAFTDNNGANEPHPFLVHDQWALRLNTAELSIYDGEDTDPANSTLITTYTGGVIDEFSIIANGAMTFHFQSYSYREEGWEAEVEQVDAYALMPPAISFEACSDNVVINANNKNAQIYYQLNNEPDPADPLQAAIEYEGPFAVEVGDIVYAIVKVGNDCSTAASLQFTSDDVTPTPGQPTITRDVNTITMTPAPIVGDINETYEVWYTTATGENPTYVQYVEPFEWTLPNTTFRAVTRARTCSDKQSEPISFPFVKVQVPDPTLTFTVTDEQTGVGTVEINCPEGYVISYTDDGTTPVASGGTTHSLTFTNVAPGTTYKAIAYKSDGNNGEDPNYQQSNVITIICIPGGDGNSGVFGTVVLLDDREDHSWSYYSNGDQPIHRLSPADVKITYLGNGITMKTNNDYSASTSSDDYETSTGVAIGVDAAANQFIYLKTLENAEEDGSGDYPYTLIPNPFSKRPTYGSGNTRWRGFQGWRVKRLSNDLSITDGTNTYGVGAIIPAETEITFVTDKEDSNEVDFEAVWARAYVNTSNSATGLNGGTYERNFIVGATPDALTVPVTYSSYNPDGTFAANASVNGFTCSADTKFEYMAISGGTFTANNHDLIMGRGLTGTATLLQGINANATNLDYTLRVESGTYSQLSFVRSQSNTVSGRYYVRGIMGSDYDRANNDNSNLSVSAGNNLFFSTAVTFSSNTNRTAKTFDLVVKSGEYQKNYWYNQATAPTNSSNPQGGGWQSSFYCGQNQGTNNYQGIRYVVVEGGEFGCMNGGRGTSATSAAYDPENNAPVVTLRIKDGLFHGAIYGGAADSETRGNRAIIITGGEIQSWVAGANNGTGTQSGSSAAVVADAYVYVGGDAIIGGDNANAVNITNGGQVFGAGRGKSDQSASVVNSYVVIADGATISNNNNTSSYPVGGNVYGGGNYGYVTTVSNVYILGGTIQRHVFGGAYGNNYVIPTSNVYVRGGTVNGSVYGGSNSNGTVGTEGVHLATVNMSDGETTNVFGGGLGESTNMANGTIVNISGGLINNNVYGGGEEGTVNGDTHVNVSGGTMIDVFGAGKGSNTSTAQVSGHTYVNVTGGTVTNVYGGGEKGDVMGDDTPAQTQTKDVIVTIYGNHNQNQNNRDYITINPTGSNNGTTTIRWPRNDNGPQSQTVSVPLDQIITVTYHRGSNGNANNIAYVIQSEDGTTNYVNQQGRPADNATNTFTVPSDPVPSDVEVRSFVTIDGGDVGGDVFGGGKMGKTGGSTQVDIENGFVRGDVFGGAYGEAGSVFVAGMHTVNVMGGRVFGSVYGGSRNANDALAFTGYNTQEKATNAVVNISGGQVDLQVYAAGYYGKTFGSVYAFVGKNAILNAPHCQPSFGDDNEEKYKATILRLEHNVWAGGDWGVFTSGSFGAPTVSGYSSIYVDGDGYNTETSNQSTPAYMNIAGSLFGCGTSCDAGTQGRMIMVRNYGYAKAGSRNENFPEPYSEATRTLYAIQRADTLIIDNSNINFTGHARINSLEATAKYAIYSFDKTVRIVNGTGLFLNTPVTQIFDFWNASCPDVYVYGATYTPIEYDGVDACENKIRVNGGNYIEVYHDKMINGTTAGYGMLNGFAYMMVAQSTSDNTCAYARPKQCTETPIDNGWDNPYDGGWVSYDPDKNTFTIGEYANGAWSSIPTLVALGGSDQMPYENHVNSSKAGEEHFRIWRAGGKYSEREAVVNITADGTSSFDFVDVTVNLPAWRTEGSYYAFQTVGEGANLNTTIDYGSEVMMFNSAMLDNGSWIHFNEHTRKQEFGPDNSAQQQIISNPNVNFGLVAMPGVAMGIETPQIGGQDVPGVIVCNEADAFLASVTGTAPNYQTVNRFPCDDYETNPQIKLRFTYHNTINTNMTWEPMFITLVQCDETGAVQDIVRIIITINTFTTLDREFITQAYAIMNETGGPSETYVTKLVLPTFDIYDVTAEHLSIFTLQSVTFEPETGYDAEQNSWIKRGGEEINGTWLTYDINHFAMQITPSLNMDNSDGWEQSNGIVDSKYIPAGGVELGETGGREPFAFDFILTYNGSVLFVGEEPRLGMLTFTITYDNVRIPTVDNNGNPVLDPDGNPTYHAGTKTLIIKVDVIRRGRGTVFYLDGINGSNANDARHPDKSALTLSTIFNRCGFLPGDIIYIVNEVDIDGYLVWSGTRYNGVTIYRYPGGHPLSQTQQYDENGNPLYTDGNGNYSTEQLEGYYPWILEGEIVDNPDNEAYTGTLVNVENEGNLIIRDITLDGHDDDHTSPVPTATGTDAEVTSDSPLINVSSGGTLTLTSGSTLKEDTNTENGGAVVVNSGGILIMNDDATIKNNETAGNGGGVYMAGTMIVSGSVQVDQNHSGESLNNVYLYTSTDPEVFGNVVQIGTHDPDDEFGPITEEARIGITKALTEDIDDWPDGIFDGFTKILYVENEEDIAWLDVPFNSRPNAIVFDDGGRYQLERFDDPQYLYWIETWVTVQYHVPTTAEGGWNETSTTVNIDTKYQLAWFISLVNGENGQTANSFEGKTININKDLNMVEHIWVPIGTSETPFKGTFEGNGHLVDSLRSILVRDEAGMFGVTENANIQDMVVYAHLNGNSINKGTVAGSMSGGMLANVEAAGYLIGRANSQTENMGGLVGLVTPNTNAITHSCFAVNDITVPTATTVVGGLVGNNGGDLYNSYANVTLIESDGIEVTTKGGLVGINKAECTIENCYVINPIGAAFADQNTGTIIYCYAAEGTAANDYVESGIDAVNHGTYGPVKGRKEIGYMYDDNTTTLVGEENPYIATELSYKNVGGTETLGSRANVIDKWPGLLSTLNQWVEVMNGENSTLQSLQPFTTWFRSTSSYKEGETVNAYINGDLPVLGFPMDNCLATIDGRFLRYSATIYNDTLANNNMNGIDALLDIYNGKTDNSYIFLYNNATKVTKTPHVDGHVLVFINEKAVLIQDYVAPTGKEDGEDGNNANFHAVVGVTFENSEFDFGNMATPNNAIEVHGTDDPLDLLYDWHMMSSPVKNAPIGTTYDMNAEMGFFKPANITNMVGNYLPDGLDVTTPALEGQLKWDLYTFYEPRYHWINLKRSTGNHWHYDISQTGVHEPIPYENEDVFEPAKGYMMAIETDSYLSNDGLLNNGEFGIELTHQSLLTNIEEYGCNLIGNPFHAYLNMQQFLNVNEDINDYYVYCAEWNLYVPNNGETSPNPALPSRTLAPFQAFFVKVNKDSYAVFNNNMAGTNAAKYSQFRGGQTSYPLVNLFVTDTIGFRDLAVIELNRPEEGGTEKLRVMNSSNFELYSHFNDKDYSILFTEEGTQRVPVWFKTQEDGVYTMTWETYHGNFSSLRLIDNLTGVNYDMLSNDSYTFEASASDYASRFYITFACTGVDEENIEHEDNFAFFDGSEWIINGKGQLEVIDMMGRVLYAEMLTSDQNRVRLDYAPGVYLIRVIDNKHVKTQKVIVR